MYMYVPSYSRPRLERTNRKLRQEEGSRISLRNLELPFLIDRMRGERNISRMYTSTILPPKKTNTIRDRKKETETRMAHPPLLKEETGLPSPSNPHNCRIDLSPLILPDVALSLISPLAFRGRWREQTVTERLLPPGASPGPATRREGNVCARDALAHAGERSWKSLCGAKGLHV